MKFKLSKKEMLQFDDDCNAAACECPQYRSYYWSIDDRKILLGEISPKELVKHWLDCGTLWKSGYHVCLSEYAWDIIKRYKEWKILKKAEKIINGRIIALSETENPGTITTSMLTGPVKLDRSSFAAQIESIENDKTNGDR